MPDAPGASSTPPEPVAPPLPPLTAVEQAVVADDLVAYKAAKADARKPPTPTAASSPAKPVDQATSTDVPVAASEPAPKGVKARTAVLDSEITELREKLRIRAALREELAQSAPAKPDAKPAASSPAPVPDHKRYLAMPDAPKASDFDDYDDLQAARAVFIADKRHEEREAAQRQQDDTARQTTDAADRQRAHDAQVDQYAGRIEVAVAADPKALEGIDPDLQGLFPSHNRPKGTPVTFGNAVADVILKSPNPVGLMRHLSDRAEVDRLSKLDPHDFLIEIGRIEAQLAKPAAVPAPKTVTDAPDPPHTLGRRPSTPGDPETSAVASGDFRAFQAAKRARGA